MLTVGFIGTGFIATAHSKRLRAAPPELMRRGPVFDIDPTRGSPLQARPCSVRSRWPQPSPTPKR